MESTLTVSAAGRRLTAASAACAVGDGAFNVTLAAFAVAVLGLDASWLGIALSAAWGLGFLTSSWWGRLADAVGLRRAAVGAALAVGGAALALSTVRAPWTLAVALVAYALAQTALQGTRQALVVALIDADARVAVRGRIQVAVNASMGAGAALAGVTLAVAPERWWYLNLVADAAAFAAAAVLMRRLPRAARPQASAARTHVDPTPSRGTSSLWELPPAHLASAAALQAALLLYMPLLTLGIPLVVLASGAPTWLIAALFALNTGGIVLVQSRAARGVTDGASARSALRKGGVGLAVSCALIGAAVAWPSAAVALLVAGVAIQVVAEALVSAGSWHVGFALSDPARPGYSQGVLAASFPLARSAGPLLITHGVLAAGLAGWGALAAVFALAGAGYGRLAVTRRA